MAKNFPNLFGGYGVSPQLFLFTPLERNTAKFHFHLNFHCTMSSVGRLILQTPWLSLFFSDKDDKP